MLLVLIGCGRAIPSTGRPDDFFVVEQGRRSGGRGVACDRGVVVASVADGAGYRGAADGGAPRGGGAAGAGEDVIEVVRGGDEWGAWGLRETAVDTA